MLLLELESELELELELELLDHRAEGTAGVCHWYQPLRCQGLQILFLHEQNCYILHYFLLIFLCALLFIIIISLVCVCVVVCMCVGGCASSCRLLPHYYRGTGTTGAMLPHAYYVTVPEARLSTGKSTSVLTRRHPSQKGAAGLRTDEGASKYSTALKHYTNTPNLHSQYHATSPQRPQYDTKSTHTVPRQNAQY